MMAYARTKIRAKKWKERPADTLDRSREREIMIAIISSLHITINLQFMSRIKTMASTSLINWGNLAKFAAVPYFLNKKLRNLITLYPLPSRFDGILTEIGQQIKSLVNFEQPMLPETLLNIKTLTRR